MASAALALKGGSGEDGARHHFERRRAGSTVDSTSLGAEKSGRSPARCAAAASGGVWRRPEEEEARVARWAAWARPRWLGQAGRGVGRWAVSLGQSVGQGAGEASRPGWFQKETELISGKQILGKPFK
jgi:hypothetical protein